MKMWCTGSEIYQNKLEAASVCVHNQLTSCEVPLPFQGLLFPVKSSVTQPNESKPTKWNVSYMPTFQECLPKASVARMYAINNMSWERTGSHKFQYKWKKAQLVYMCIPQDHNRKYLHYLALIIKGRLFQAQVKVNHQVNSGNSQSYVVSRQNQRVNYLVNSPS